MPPKGSNGGGMVGREDEIDRVVCILSRKSKNSAVLVGAPGVGKTAIAEGLAQRIARGEGVGGARRRARGDLSVPAMISGTTYRGTFEERVTGVIAEAEAAGTGKVVLFVDEIHMLLGAGRVAGGCMDASNMLKPALARGRVRCLGATTHDEYQRYFVRDAAFERRFQKVHVAEPGEGDTVAILRRIKAAYEEHHGMEIQDEALVAAPGSPAATSQIVSKWTGIPVTNLGQDERKRLLDLPERLHKRVIDQDEAVGAVAEAPSGSFLFLGPTGVGKTELAKALAEQLFGNEKLLVRIDMFEYVSGNSVTRLIGSAPGSYGYEKGGQLTEMVRQRPYSVVLFDEVEKADSAVTNLFLQILDDGRLTDGQGRTVDFTNTIVILTSNLGAHHLHAAEWAAAGPDARDAARQRVVADVQRHFRPELVNRLGEMVVFHPLSGEQLRKVARMQLRGLAARLADKGVGLDVTDAALDVVLSRSGDQVQMYGARPVKRCLQKHVMARISKMFVQEEVDDDCYVSVDADEEKKDLVFTVEKPGSEETEAPAPSASSSSKVETPASAASTKKRKRRPPAKHLVVLDDDDE
ncbi:hypothetical protein EJB05_56992, partial [Eragrostis curvula]